MGAGAIDSDCAWSSSGSAVTVTYGFRSTASQSFSGFQRCSVSEIASVKVALQFWQDLCGITFSLVETSGQYTNNASMLFGDSTSEGSYAVQGSPGTLFPTDVTNFFGDVVFGLNNGSISNDGSLAFGGYAFQTMVHEIGHAIGLTHAGPYNGVVNTSQVRYVNDTNQYTTMSYLNPNLTGAYFGSGYNKTGQATTPMMFDILAVQNLYGVNNATRATDTIYGFYSTAGSAYLFSGSSALSAFCIWDGGGTDTIDVSGFAQSQLINLCDGTFSDVGGLTSNVSIAVGCAIENVKGGSGQDVIFGNTFNNVLTGGAGNDLIFGGVGNDTAIFSGTRSQYVISQITDGWQVAGTDGTDWLFNVEFAQFSDQTATLASNASYNITSYVKTSISENKATGSVYTVAGTDVDNNSLTYVLGGLDANLFNISTSGAVSFRTAPIFGVPTDFGSDNTYNITVRAFDGANYSDAQEVAVTVTKTAKAGDAVINLGPGYGQLIAPVQVDGGKWFYYWDLSGDGTSAGYDSLNHNTLDDIFKYDANGIANTTITNADGFYGSTDVYRFGTINGVSLALPTIGGVTSSPFGANGVGFNQPGTSIGSVNSSNGSNVINSTYNDLLAVWDAYNGISTNTGTSGTPPNWINDYYWSATPTTIGHAAFGTGSGFVLTAADTPGGYVALQVL